MFATYRCLNPMHSIISIFCHDLLLILSFFLSTWPLTFNLWHLFKEVNNDTVLFHQETFKWNIKISLLKVLHSRKICPWSAFHFNPKMFIVTFAKRDYSEKHGTSLFCNLPELLYKVVEFIPVQCRSFQYIGQTWEPILYQVRVRYIFDQRYFIFYV